MAAREENPRGLEKVDWRTKPAVVPLPGREPYMCVLCRDRIEPGTPVRWGPRKAYGVHDECARKLPPLPIEAPKKGKAGPPIGPTSLDRWTEHGEGDRQHRALLLWAMQHDERRSQKSTARAVGVAVSTIRKWAAEHSWTARVQGTSGRADERAVRLYRELYIEAYGPTELPEVATRVVVPLGVTPREVKERPPSEVEENLAEADRRVREEILRKRKADDELRQRHVKLVDGAIGYVVKAMQEGKIRVSLRDIPALFSVRAMLTGVANEASQGTSGPIESMRVRVAREQGTDFLDAVAEDVEELGVIVSTLRGRRAAPAEEEGPAPGPGLRVVEPAAG